MKTIYFIIISTILFYSTSVFSQSDQLDNNKQILSKLASFKKSHYQEKIYIHFDKNYYSVNEIAWFKVYLVNAIDHTKDTSSNIVYVELINPNHEVLTRKIVKVNNLGGEGQLELSKELPEGEYTVRAYTNLMQNYNDEFYYYKKILIWNAHNSGKTFETISPKHTKVKEGNEVEKKNVINVRFFPEGGDLVENLLSVVAFKVSDSNGKYIDIEGSVFDNFNRKITDIKTQKFGMGVFNILPQNENTYFAEFLISGKKYQFNLPKIKKEGYVLRINNNGDDEILVNIKTNNNDGLKDAQLIGHMRSKIFIDFNQFPDKEEVNLKIKKDLLPDGVFHFTLFNKNIPQCERLIFIQNVFNQVYPKVILDKKKFHSREPVQLKISLNEAVGETVKGNLSISISKAAVSNRHKEKANIKSYLLLTSDLKGKVHNPNYYFSGIDHQKKNELDYLMMCHGWRRFLWEEVLKEKDNNKLAFSSEKGFSISGRISWKNNTNEPVQGIVKLVVDNNFMSYKELKTNEKGKFIFKGLDFLETNDILLEALAITNKGKKIKQNNNVTIQLDEMKKPAVRFVGYRNIETIELEASIKDKYLTEIDRRVATNSLINYNKEAIVLKELTISETKKFKDDFFTPIKSYYHKPDHRVVMDSLPGTLNTRNVLELLASQVPGLRYSQSVNGIEIILRGFTSLTQNNKPFVTLDNNPVDINDLAMLRPTDIHHIDVVQSPTAMGIRGAGGLIAVYSKTSNFKYNENNTYSNIINFKSPSYSKVRVFYSPVYNSKDLKTGQPDQRITMYWNPNIDVNEYEETKVNFYTSDNMGTYKISIEGLTNEGIPFTFEDEFIVEEDKYEK